MGVSIPVSIGRRGMRRKLRTCLVYNINKFLCVVCSETMDGSSAVLFQEDFIDQRGELVRSKRTSGQTSAGCGVIAETDKSESDQGSAKGRRGWRRRTYHFPLLAVQSTWAAEARLVDLVLAAVGLQLTP